MTLLLSMPGGSEWIFIIFSLGIFLIPKIFYLITLQSTFDTISLKNRRMSSGNVWLLLIPIFGTIWHFIVVNKMADSIKAETDEMNIKIFESRPAYNIGLSMCILDCLFVIPIVKILSIIAGLICWILYWVKINYYKNILLRARINSYGTNI